MYYNLEAKGLYYKKHYGLIIFLLYSKPLCLPKMVYLWLTIEDTSLQQTFVCFQSIMNP